MSMKANKKQAAFLATQNTHTTNNLAIKISVKITCGRPRKKRANKAEHGARWTWRGMGRERRQGNCVLDVGQLAELAKCSLEAGGVVRARVCFTNLK